MPVATAKHPIQSSCCGRVMDLATMRTLLIQLNGADRFRIDAAAVQFLRRVGITKIPCWTCYARMQVRIDAEPAVPTLQELCAKVVVRHSVDVPDELSHLVAGVMKRTRPQWM